ncbi:FHA domain-containing protein [Microbacterium trichothecenolyticum]|uniref:DUF5684 domain-containing protein n=1 Tax=Microbacterium trichothecenolyticum TaxID=69370 RepID=UPI001C6F4561|nr:DUF5684 domain-containing protein [Microbacterium trichothecenolyticum]MBW9121977.1 FHA domain-containing protein [Microbacterium trichothecenolyticum]
MNAPDATAAVVGTLISLLLFAGLYVWTALALSAVFRKSGVEAWQAWVPVLNTIVLLRLAGLSPWLVILAFIPFVNIAFLVVWAIALFRVNVAFGYGAGMTVLGFLAFPVWASIVGWGSARWVGRETDAATRASFGAGARRTPGEAGLASLPPFPASARTDAPTAYPPAPPAFPPAPTSAGDGFAPPSAYAQPAPGAAPAAPAPAMPPAPPAPPVAHAPVTAAVPVNPAVPGISAPPAPEASVSGEADVAPPAAGWTPPPLPGRPVSAPPAEMSGNGNGNGSGDADRWQGFALDGIDLSDEVTGAVPGAPAPISAVPATPLAAVPPAAAAAATAGPARTAAEPFTAPEAATTGEEGITRPPVTRVPAPSASNEDHEPWAPARSPMSEADAFPEASGPVSAISGAPDAGSPRSARSSVSAFHTKPEIPDDQDTLEETIIARRKRTDWALVPPTGEPVALSSEVVILGRRPAADPEHPGAQLVSIQDGTVSKTHARLQLRDDKWYVTDLDSTNGVLFATVMGTEVEAPAGVEVEAGDRFLLGDAEVRLRRSDG